MLDQAMQFIELHRPDISSEKKREFARSVYYLVVGWAPDASWSSARELGLRRRYSVFAGNYSFAAACRFLLTEKGPIFGPLSQECWDVLEDECTSNNDPEDWKVILSSNGPDARPV